MNIKNIIITGSTGFLGGSTYKHLSNKYNLIPLTTKEVLNLDLITDKINSLNIDGIINFGWSGASNSKDLNSIEQFDNIKTAINLFNFSIQSKIKLFIQISSSWKYSERFGLNNYGFCKSIVDDILLQMSKETSVKFITAIPWWIYGIGDKENRFIPSIIKKCLKNETINLHPAQNLVDYLYIDDFVSAIDALLQNIDNISNIYNFDICSGVDYKVMDIVELIKSLTNSNSNILYTNKYPPNFNMRWVGDNINLLNLGWLPKTNISEGIIKILRSHNE